MQAKKFLKELTDLQAKPWYPVKIVHDNYDIIYKHYSLRTGDFNDNLKVIVANTHKTKPTLLNEWIGTLRTLQSDSPVMFYDADTDEIYDVHYINKDIANNNSILLHIGKQKI